MKVIKSNFLASIRSHDSDNGKVIYTVNIERDGSIFQCIDLKHATELYKSITKCIGVTI